MRPARQTLFLKRDGQIWRLFLETDSRVDHERRIAEPTGDLVFRCCRSMASKIALCARQTMCAPRWVFGNSLTGTVSRRWRRYNGKSQGGLDWCRVPLPCWRGGARLLDGDFQRPRTIRRSTWQERGPQLRRGSAFVAKKLRLFRRILPRHQDRRSRSGLDIKMNVSIVVMASF